MRRGKVQDVRGLMGLAVVVMALGPAAVAPAQEGEQPAQPGQEQEAETVAGEQLFPLEERSQVFRIIEGDREGERIELSLRGAEEDEPGEWVWRLSNLNVLYLQRDNAGNVEVVRMDLPKENRAAVYDPPVRLIPAEVRPQYRQSVAEVARIYNIETGEQVRVGEVSHAIEQVSRSRFDTPAGEMEGYLVVIDHTIDLDLGQLRLNLECGYVPGQGSVYRHTRYTIDKLGLFGETTRRTAVLTEER